ncbi:hypothetical protein ABFX02_09G098000 [Erythranthe guttata]
MNQEKHIRIRAPQHHLIIVFILIFAIIQEASAASFIHCFEACELGCIVWKKNAIVCGLLCLGQCIIHHPQNLAPTSLNYCQYGCALHKCSNFGKDFEKMEKCVESCGNDCSLSGKSKSTWKSPSSSTGVAPTPIE